MSNTSSTELDLVADNIASLVAHNPNRTVTDDDHPATLATTDIQPYVQHKKHVMTNIEASDTQANDTAEAASSLSAKNLPTSETSANPPAKNSRDTPESLLQRTSSPSSANLSDKPDPEVASTTIQSTAPVPVVYPPRRPNIFKTGQKHVRFPLSDLNAVAPCTVGIATQELEAADGFSVADLQEFQAEIREKMKKKSAMFMSMVRQSTWKQRRVEDLGEVFEIEG